MNTNQELRRFIANGVEDGDFDRSQITLVKEVCPCCDGKGKTWHGWHSDDACSFTSSEWDELGQDGQDGYMSGRYDQTCPECEGQNVIDVIDPNGTDPAVFNQWCEWVDDAYESDAIERQERAMGC